MISKSLFAVAYFAGGLPLVMCMFYEHSRAEHYKFLFEDAESIVDAQSHSLNEASIGMAQASGGA